MVRGRYVAWVLATVELCSQCRRSDRLFLADARSGRRVDFGGVGCELPPPESFSPVVFGSLALTAHGRFAWICHGETRTEVHKLDADGPALLDVRTRNDPGSDAIDSSSLAIAPDSGHHSQGRVYWSTQNGPHFADLR